MNAPCNSRLGTAKSLRFRIVILLATSFVFTTCAMYLGYHYEDCSQTETVILARSFSDVELRVLKPPTKNDAQLVFEVSGKENRSVQRKNVIRVDRYYEYDTGEIVAEPFLTGFLGGMFPFIDLIRKVCGQTPPAGEGNDWDDYKPRYWYFRNYLYWPGWVLPFIQAMDSSFNDRKRTDLGLLTSPPEIQEIEKRSLDSVSLVFDLGPQGREKVVTDSKGTGVLDLKPHLYYLWIDFDWEIVPSIDNGEFAKRIRLMYNTSDLGVTWSLPLAKRDNPPHLHIHLAVSDADGDAILEAGESARAICTVKNVGDATAWGLQIILEEPSYPLGVLKVCPTKDSFLERLEPGQTWEAVTDLRCADESALSENIVLTAKVLDSSRAEHRKAMAEIATRAFDPPRLKLAALKWSDGNNGILEQGDRLTLRLWTQNIGLGEAKGVRVTLESSDSTLKLSEPFPEDAHLEPSELKEFVWNLAIPEGWTPPNGDLKRELPVNVSIIEERSRFSVPAEPLGLALGDRTAIETSSQESTELAELQKVAKEAIAEARKTKELQAELKRQQQQEEELQRELAELMAQQKKVEEEELRKKEELERRRREREQARQRAQTERNLLRKCSYAIIVGINAYEDPAIGDLRYAEADARAMANALTDPRTGLFAPENVILLTTDAQDPHLRPTRPNVFEALTNMSERLSSQDRILFFFAGHGTTEEKADDTYLLPQDAPLNTARYQGLRLKGEILDILENCPAQKKIIIVDACHSGLRKYVRGERDLELVSTGIQTALEAFENRGSGRVVFASSSRNQISHEDEDLGHGVFTYYLVEGLNSLATSPTSEADKDLDGHIEAGELFEYVAQRVESWCTAKRRGLQTPRSSYDDAGASIALAAQPQND